MCSNPDRLQRDIAGAIGAYRDLLEALVMGTMSADEFETRYLEAYLHNDRLYNTAVFNVVDAFFADVDAYVSNPDLRDPDAGDLGPVELRERARELLRRAGYEW